MGNEQRIDEGDIILEKHIIGHPESLSKEQIKKILEQMDNSVCKIIKEKNTGTGFICLIPFPNKLYPLPVLITCYHVLTKKELEPGKFIKLMFNESQKLIKINESRKIFTSDEKEYDISIIELLPEDNFDLNNLLEIENDIFKNEILNNIYKNKSIYIIHYPKGKEANYSVDTIKEIDINNIKMKHFCATKDGSSGGPILNLQTYNVLGIHNGKKINGEWNIGTILKHPIYDFQKKYKNNLNQKFIVNKLMNDENFAKIKEKSKINNNVEDIHNGDNSIDIEIFDDYICKINYKLSKKYIKEFGFLIKIPFQNSNTSTKGILTKYHLSEEIIKEINLIKIFKDYIIIKELNINDIFIISDPFLDITFIELKELNFNYIKIAKNNEEYKKPLILDYSEEKKAFQFIKGKVLGKWGANIFYEEEIVDYNNIDSCNYIGLLINNKLYGIHNQVDYQYKIATNIQIISKVIELNFNSKIKNLTKNIEKEGNLSTNKHIQELKSKGLELTPIRNIFISLPSEDATPIWFYRTRHAWYWTPTKPDKNHLNKANWMIIFPGNSLKAIGGEWDEIKPVQRNRDLIHWLEKTDLKYLI